MGRLKTRPNCPTCNKLLDGFNSMEKGEKPKPGDLTICAYCSEVLQFTDDMHLKVADHKVIEQVGLLKISQTQGIVKKFRRKFNYEKI